MHILDLINSWSQFVQYIIDNDFLPFTQIVQLIKTCKSFYNNFHSTTISYSLLCKFHLRKINISIFIHPNILYKNEYEKRLFNKIYFHKLRSIDLCHAVSSNTIILIDLLLDYRDYCIETDIITSRIINSAIIQAACENNIKMLDKLILFGYKFKDLYFIINEISKNGYVDVIEWFFNASQKYPNQLTFEYLSNTVDLAAKYGHLNIIKWFYNLSLKYPNFQFKYTNDAIDLASCNKRIEVLNWFVEQSVDGLQLLYKEDAIDFASENGHTNILRWWLNSGLELKYSVYSMDYAARSCNMTILNWFLELYLVHDFPLKYSEYSITWAAMRNCTRVLDWFFNIYINYKIPFKHDVGAINYASQHAYMDILNWFDNHSSVEWLQKNGYPESSVIKFLYSDAAFDFDANISKTSVLQWWAKRFKNLN